MILAAHQPNFIPNMAFFEKIRACDLFVILKEVQFEKNNYQNRFQFRQKWYTMRVRHGNVPIKEKKYLDAKTDFNNILFQLDQLSLDTSSLREIEISNSLCETNVNIISRICSIMEIKTPIELDYPTKETSTSRLIELCRHFGADTYLSGPSGRNYLEIEKFVDNKIDLQFFDSKLIHPSETIEEICRATNNSY